MELTSGLRIVPKLEEWFLILGVFFLSEDYWDLVGSDVTLVILHFITPCTRTLSSNSLGPKFCPWPKGLLDFGGSWVLDPSINHPWESLSLFVIQGSELLAVWWFCQYNKDPLEIQFHRSSNFTRWYSIWCSLNSLWGYLLISLSTPNDTFVDVMSNAQYGYMAPEQFQNRSTLQTDLYGLGGTMLYMISGRSPSYFPQVDHSSFWDCVFGRLSLWIEARTHKIMFARQKRLKVEFRNIVSMSPGLAGIIEKLLEPAPEDRFQVIIFSLLQGGLHLLLK